MSHFDSIGFCVRSREEFGKVVSTTFKLAKIQLPETKTDRTYRWSDGNAELWFHPDADWCVVPAFSKGTRIKFDPDTWVESSNNCSYCAILCGRVCDPESNLLYPLAVTFGNVKEAKFGIEIGKICELKIIAFIENGNFWASLSEYENHPSPKLAERGFFPLGPFSGLDSSRTNTPRAIICGTVRNINNLQNSQTGNSYRWLTIESYGYTYEAVISDTLLPDIGIDSIVQVECWLCAELIS
jgi:hypothetical protein